MKMILTIYALTVCNTLIALALTVLVRATKAVTSGSGELMGMWIELIELIKLVVVYFLLLLGAVLAAILTTVLTLTLITGLTTVVIL